MKRVLTSFATAALLALPAAPLSAQVASSPVRFGIMGGATLPLSDFKDIAKTGWNAGALVDIGLPLVPVSFRVDGQWHQLDGKTIGTATTDFRIIDGTANVLYTFGTAAPTKFYLIGGVGVYNLRAKVEDTGLGIDDSNSDTKFGLNAGAGFRFQLTGFSTFIEARYHNIFSGFDNGSGDSKSLQMIPIVVGFTF